MFQLAQECLTDKKEEQCQPQTLEAQLLFAAQEAGRADNPKKDPKDV